jgi:hypothetical protein
VVCDDPLHAAALAETCTQRLRLPAVAAKAVSRPPLVRPESRPDSSSRL